MKICNVCKLKVEKISNSGKCKSCQKEYDAAYYRKNKVKILTNKKEYYQENKDFILKDAKGYYLDHKEEKHKYNLQYYENNKEQILIDVKAYANNHKDEIRIYHNEYNKQRRENDLIFKIRATISASINYYLKSNGSSKNGESCLNYLPYTINDFNDNLEYQFEDWMTWDNYGRYDASTWNDEDKTTWTWQIDHKMPQSTFSFMSMEDDNFQACWALNNIRPLSSKQNFLDGVSRIRHK